MPAQASSRPAAADSGPGAGRWDAWDVGALLALVAGGVALGLAFLHNRPDLHHGAGFLFGDQGYSLHMTDALLDGRTLYADIASPYGPVAAHAYAAAAALYGNSAATYNAFFLAVSALNFGLVYVLLRRHVSRPAALLTAALGLVPSLLIPGALLGGFTSSPYVPLERTLLILLAIFWRPPDRRTRMDAYRLGLVLGIWPGIRFGAAFFAGAAMLVADALCVASATERMGLGRWARTLGGTLLVFVLCQVAWAAHAFATLPRAVAVDVLWPYYISGSYAGWVTPDLRWPGWYGWGIFFGQYLTPAVGAVGAAWVVSRLWVRRGAPQWERGSLALLIPAFFFVLGALLFFRHVFHFHQFMWTLAVPVALLAQQAGGRARLALAALLVPCLALNLKATFLNPVDAALHRVRTPAGEVLWVSPAVATGLAAVLRAAGATPPHA
ncbi:MAG TPA: hypothetical protein VGX50_06180, partial [Longimicrobium sp.]|nr:hypothetical protein [Longimicrobium sp.]